MGTKMFNRETLSAVTAGLGLYLGFVLLIVLLQTLDGAMTAEFGEYPDEAAHYVTGLMAQDFLRQGNWRDPLGFAEQYYIRYPKVAIGHWGPVFSGVQAGWGLVFGASRVSIMLLMASGTALLAVMIYKTARPEASRPAALTAAVCFVMRPTVQRLTGSVMTEIWSTLFMFLAAWAFGRFLARERYRDIVAFSGFASLAILTKGDGLLLSLLPLFAMLFARRLDLLLRPRLWLAAVLVAVACGPWFLLTLNMQRNGMLQESFSWHFVFEAVPYYATAAVSLVGVGMFALFVAGFARQVVRFKTTATTSGKWAALAGLISAVVVFHMLVPCGWEDRHLLPAVPAMLAFAAVGIDLVAGWLAHVACGRSEASPPQPLVVDRLPAAPSPPAPLPPEARGETDGAAAYAPGSPQPCGVPGDCRPEAERRTISITGLIAAALVVSALNLPDVSNGGLTRIAKDLEARPTLRNSVLMVSADEIGDGMCVATVAMRDRRPHRVVLRASKVLSSSRWDGREYRALFSTPEDVQTWLESVPVGVLILDRTIDGSKYPEYRLLEEAISKFPDRWLLLGTYPTWRAGRLTSQGLAAYCLEGHERRPRGKIVIGLGDKLGKSLELKE